MYTNQVQDPRERANKTFSFRTLDDIFTNDEINKIVAYCEAQGTKPGKIISQNGLEIVEDGYRKSDIKFHSCNQDTVWIFQRVFQAAEFINENYYNFNLNGCDSFQYTEYNGRDSKSDYHIDTILGPIENFGQTRKLSLSICLSAHGKDYTGGDFHIVTNPQHPFAVEQKKGKAIFFPSFVMHGVTPILSGSRKALVFWFTGPKFQ